MDGDLALTMLSICSTSTSFGGSIGGASTGGSSSSSDNPLSTPSPNWPEAIIPTFTFSSSIFTICSVEMLPDTKSGSGTFKGFAALRRACISAVISSTSCSFSSISTRASLMDCKTIFVRCASVSKSLLRRFCSSMSFLTLSSSSWLLQTK